MEIPKSLLTRIFDKKCILFLGSGATKDSGGDIGSELSKHIYSEIGDIDVKYSDDLSRYTQRLEKKGYRDDFEDIVRKRFENIKPSEKFKKVTQIPWKAIYTTNYDDLIEKSYKEESYYDLYKEDILNPSYYYETNTVPLYKINGCINDRNQPMVITINDIKNNINTRKDIITRLANDLSDTFVFIGYSFQDSIITSILDEFLITSQWTNIKEKYLITPRLSDENKEDLEEIYKIKYIRGKADDFFDFLNNKVEKNFEYKLKRLNGTIKNNELLEHFENKLLYKMQGCFDYYMNQYKYPVDFENYYRGGNIAWGLTENDADVNRKIKIVTENGCTKSTIYDMSNIINELINELVEDRKMKRMLLTGPAICGKTTALYRLAYELHKYNVLSLIHKPQAQYRDGLLNLIYNSLEKPFIVLIDDLSINSNEAYSMISDARKYNLPIIFIFATRYSEWENQLTSYQKSRLEPFEIKVEIDDSLDPLESEKLIDKLSKTELLKLNTEVEKKAMIKRFSRSKNLIEILLKTMDKKEFNDSICDEYDSLTDQAKMAYGIVSIFYQYGYMLKWEMLQRTVKDRFQFTWNDFVKQILQSDAKGNLFSEERQGRFLIRGRHRYISKFIIDIHYKGQYSKQLEDIKTLIASVNIISEEERDIGTLLKYLLDENSSDFSDKELLELVDLAIDKFKYDYNIGFLLHIKGEFHVKNHEYNKAIECFETNISNGSNEQHSLHSIGKTYYYLAQNEKFDTGTFRNYINESIRYLYRGVERFKDNEYYYSTFFDIISYLKKYNVFSEKDQNTFDQVVEYGENYLGKNIISNMIE